MWSVGLEDMTRHRREMPAGADNGYGADGRPATPTETALAFEGTTNPPPDKVVDTLPEGTRMSDVLMVLTTTDLRAEDDNSPQHLADHVTVAGEKFKVMRVERYRKLIPHVEATCVRIKTA